MNKACIHECMELLSMRFQTRKVAFGLEQIKHFGNVLSGLDTTLGRRAVEEYLLASPHLPDLGDLLRTYARLIAPFPDWELAWSEVEDYVQTYGRNGAYKDADSFLRVEGMPTFSHPLVTYTMGAIGYVKYCDGECQFEEGIVKRFRATYEGYAERWVARIVQLIGRGEELALPAYLSWRPGTAERLLRARLPQQKRHVLEAVDALVPIDGELVEETLVRLLGAREQVK